MPDHAKERIPTLDDLLKTAIREELKGVHTMLPAQIEKFDSSTQRAELTITISTPMKDGTTVKYPQLINVPVQFMRWGGFSITMPVKKGDQVAVFFSERSIQTWLERSVVQDTPNDVRFFDLNDAYAIPGLSTDSNKVPNLDTDNLVLKSDNGATEISLSDDGEVIIKNDNTTIQMFNDETVKIENSSGEVIDLISQILAALEIESVTVTGGSSAGTYPLTGQTTYAAIKLIWDTFKS